MRVHACTLSLYSTLMGPLSCMMDQGIHMVIGVIELEIMNQKNCKMITVH